MRARIAKFSNRTEADRHYLEEAYGVRKYTDDPKGKVFQQSAVGAVIASENGIIAQSANVLPPAIRSTFTQEGRTVSDEDRYFLIEHAERAAIFEALASHADLSKATIYCTRFPCSDCARAIVWSGIKRAVFSGGFAGEKRWLTSQRAALRILRDGGLTVRYITLHHDTDAEGPDAS
ncbi:deoxycytidylate deaminase [Paraburkholderia sp. RAU2J]|nr:deoxycytidylate deaminase [Paraburkholderia sp. RAU2J]